MSVPCHKHKTLKPKSWIPDPTLRRKRTLNLDRRHSPVFRRRVLTSEPNSALIPSIKWNIYYIVQYSISQVYYITISTPKDNHKLPRSIGWCPKPSTLMTRQTTAGSRKDENNTGLSILSLCLAPHNPMTKNPTPLNTSEGCRSSHLKQVFRIPARRTKALKKTNKTQRHQKGPETLTRKPSRARRLQNRGPEPRIQSFDNWAPKLELKIPKRSKKISSCRETSPELPLGVFLTELTFKQP